MSPRLRLMSLAAALLLAACAGPAAYAPREGLGAPGYSDEQITANRYRVTFTGNSATPRETVEKYLLLHAAEVAERAGYRYFIFDTRDTKAHTIYHSDVEPWPPFGWYWRPWMYEGPLGPQIETTSSTRYDAYAEIVLLTDEQAKSEPRAIDAQDVIAHLGPEAHKPPRG
ncbi:MAG: hypothetical protein KGJ78_11055 [Alphaproteobacteria bacterium]|nr:hypothetical protein [Alphaproteobacteria bacterium]